MNKIAKKDTEVLHKLGIATAITKCPCLFVFIAMLLPIISCILLVYPELNIPTIDMDYNQFSVEGHPTSIRQDIHEAAPQIGFRSNPEGATVSSKNNRNLLNLDFLYDDNFDVNNSLRKLLNEKERQLTHTQQLLLIYRAKEKETNILQAKYIQAIRNIENSLINIPEWENFCVLDSNRNCKAPMSVMNYFLPPITNGNVQFDGKGIDMANVDDAVDYLVKNNILDFFDMGFTSLDRQSTYISTVVKFGVPLNGYIGFGIVEMSKLIL